MKATDDMGRRAMLIEMLDRRRAASAVPALLEQLARDDGNVRSRALTALGRLASAEDVPEMIAATLADSSLADSAQRAITDVCRRVGYEADQADPVLQVYTTAGDAMKNILLPLLGRIGGAKALEAVRKALVSNDDARVEAGVLALTNWPTAEVASDLADLAERLNDEGQKIRAIRGLARVVVLDGLHSDADELALLKRAMKQATRDDERRLILDRAREARSIDTANFAAEYLDTDGPVAEQACKTIVDLLHRAEIRGPNAEASDRLLKRVIATTKNKKLAEDAGKYLSTL
jgi:HEAT repeat protein